MKSLIAVMETSGNCNMACSYCYMENPKKRFMKDETVANATSKILQEYDKVRFIWHGGEPLLLPIEFYKKAVEEQHKHPGKRVYNSIQTNGTLLTDEMIDFCKANHFELGFSLDGPKEIHDLTRRYKDNQSSFQDTLDAIKKARAHDLGSGFLVVLNRQNINRLDEIYDFAVSERLSLQINALMKSGKGRENYDALHIQPVEYGRAMTHLFDRWVKDDLPIEINPLREITKMLLTGSPEICVYTKNCQGSYLAIDAIGDVYPCSKFCGNDGFALGNINTDSLETILTCPVSKDLGSRKDNLKSCDPCEYKRICNGGCMYHALREKGTVHAKDPLCVSNKILFDHIKGYVIDAMKKDATSAEGPK